MSEYRRRSEYLAIRAVALGERVSAVARALGVGQTSLRTVGYIRRSERHLFIKRFAEEPIHVFRQIVVKTGSSTNPTRLADPVVKE